MDKFAATDMASLCQIALCLYGARFSYVAIMNLRKYEEITKKASKWSSEVDRQLQMTRKTQATGALCVCILT